LRNLRAKLVQPIVHKSQGDFGAFHDGVETRFV
jgi:hypothetical protein